VGAVTVAAGWVLACLDMVGSFGVAVLHRAAQCLDAQHSKALCLPFLATYPGGQEYRSTL
jgi:hypothetical protein